MRAELLRHMAIDNSGIFGRLIFDDEMFCFTKEPLWIYNQPKISSIPAGMYICKKTKSPKFGRTYTICNVDGRYHILFHWGSKLVDTKGCILVGNNIVFCGAGKEIFLTGTRATHKRMMKTIIDETFQIEIVNCF